MSFDSGKNLLVNLLTWKIFNRLENETMTKGNWKEFGDSFENSTVSKNHENISFNSNRKVRVQRTKVGKSGKTVTVISGLELDTVEFKRLLKKLKATCGTGGSMKGDFLELQGDQIDNALSLLIREGFSPKRSGG